MRFEFDVPDDLVAVVLEIMEESSLPGWEDNEGRCTPGFIMKRLKITQERYLEAERVLENIRPQLDNAARELRRPEAEKHAERVAREIQKDKEKP